MEFYSFDNITWYQSMMEKYGAVHKVIPFWWDVAMIERGKKAMNRELLELAAKEKLDFVFFNVAEDELHIETIKQITNSAVTLYWCSDDSWHYGGSQCAV